MRNILITNDDGIMADGIIRLARAAKAFGQVWVVAPDSQRSAASHSITLHSPVDVYPHDFPVDGVHAFSCSGTPGDCVRVGSLFIMPSRPDVVLSGINHGYNVASDIQYSATAGAALEGAFQGFPAIALSEEACDCHEVTDAYLPEVLERLLEGETSPQGKSVERSSLHVSNLVSGKRALSRSSECDAHAEQPFPVEITNVNFPGCPLSECRGILENRTVSRGMVFRDRYNEVCRLDGGGFRLMVEGIYQEKAEEGTDFRALIDHYISVGTVRNIG